MCGHGRSAFSIHSATLWLWLQSTIGLAMPVTTRWGTVNRMMHSMVQNEASLKLAVSYPEFPGNPASRVSAADRTRGRDIKKSIEDARYWQIVKGIKAFTQPPSDVSCNPVQNFLLRRHGAASSRVKAARRRVSSIPLTSLTAPVVNSSLIKTFVGADLDTLNQG